MAHFTRGKACCSCFDCHLRGKYFDPLVSTMNIGPLAVLGLIGTLAMGSSSWRDDCLCDRNGRQELREMKTRILECDGPSITKLVFSPDGNTLASGIWEGGVIVRNVGTGRILFHCLQEKGFVFDAMFSPDGKILATASDGGGGARLWDASSGKELFRFPAYRASAFGITLTPDGKEIAIASNDDIKVWDVATRRELKTLGGFSGRPLHPVFSPDNKRLACSPWEGARVWNRANRFEEEVLPMRRHDPSDVAFSSDNAFLATCTGAKGHGETKDEDARLTVWNLKTRQVVMDFQAHDAPSAGVAFLSDSKRIVTAATDGTICCWEVPTGRLLFSIKAHTDKLHFFALSSDGKRLACPNSRGVELWDSLPGP